MSRRVPDRVQTNMPETVAIVGIGGVGSWLSLFISEFKDVERIALFDSDVVEDSNLERTPFKKKDVGEDKTSAMKELLEERRTELLIQEFDNLTEKNKQILNLYDLKIASCDGVEPRNMVLEYDNSISAGYDVTEEADNITVSEEGPIWAVDGGPDGYTIDPSWCVPAVLTALLTVYAVGRDRRPVHVSSNIEYHFDESPPNNQEEFRIVSD